MPRGRRHTKLEEAARGMFAEDLEGRILPFDTEAAAPMPNYSQPAERLGGQTGPSISCWPQLRAHGASIVTRNVAHFEGSGVMIVNPWDE